MANEITAVNKLYIYLLGIVSFDSEQLRNLYEESFEKAKQMEKEQIIQFADEYADAVMGGCINRAEEYYNETYGSQAPQRLEQANGTNLPKE